MEKKYTGISSDKKGNIGYVFFDDPATGNRTGYKETAALIQALKDSDSDKDVKAIILSGKGGAFCSGGKIDGFPEGPLVDQREYGEIGIVALKTIMGLSKPIIAAVNADALAGGLMFMEACDLAVAGRSVKFGLPELQRGYFPMLALAMLEKALPKKRFFQLAFTCDLVDAETMYDWNMINEVVDDDMVMAKAEEIALKIASFSSMPVSFGRDTYYKMYDMNLTSSLNYSKCALLNLLWTDDVRETGRAQAEGRPPVYKGR